MLGWGDAYATRTHVEAAVRMHNEDELVTLIPAAASLIADGDWEHLPGIFDAVRSGQPPVPTRSCKHEFFHEPRKHPSEIHLGTCEKCANVVTLSAAIFADADRSSPRVRCVFPQGVDHQGATKVCGEKMSWSGTLFGPCAACGKNASLE